jgi:hypothetical protein
MPTTDASPAPVDPTLPEGFRWAACSQRLSITAAAHRHAVRRGALDTVCGHSATHTDIWRANSTKPACPACTERLTS